MGLYIQSKVKKKLAMYARFPNHFGLSGKEVAERMLADHGLMDVRVMSLPKKLRDHYNPSDKTLNLSPEVYGGRSISAAAVAVHECGHALQAVNNYPGLAFRSAMAPIVAAINRVLSIVLLILLIVAYLSPTITVGEMLFIVATAQTITVVFTLLTLPAEKDASRRGIDWLKGTELNVTDQLQKTTDAIDSTSLTYLMQAMTSPLQFFDYLFVFQTGPKT